MAWEVVLNDDFAAWLDKQEKGLRVAILAAAKVLEAFGPSLGRPRVDSLRGSQFSNMKELRVQYGGRPWRVLFAFDHRRTAVLLVGGDKGDDSRWYATHIPEADGRFARHLQAIREETNGKEHR